ncbi:MAG: hypothetical protein LBV43_11970 [Prevotella sp.]|jgi:uncharacterized membrane protein YfcA|nr:hypothetical protein [Prevotella sp.]
MNTDATKLIVICAISVIAIIIIWRIIHVNIKNGKSFGEYSTKLIAITFIVAMALIAFIYDASNSSSAFALLGTLAGYFLGYKKEKTDRDNE